MENQIMNLEQMQGMLSQTILVMKTNTESNAVILEELGRQKDLVGGLVKKFNGLTDGVSEINDRMTALEQNEEITETQAETLNASIKRRIAEILSYDEFEMAKYFRGFIFQCYKEMRKYHGMGASYRRTKKRDYARLIDEVEAWIPSMGVIQLKTNIDDKALAKRKANQLGY